MSRPPSDPPMPSNAGIHITDIEAAINWWRQREPSPDGVTLAAPLRALAEVYALMVFYREEEAAERGFPPKAWAAWKAWYDSTPDTPCIAICSTSQGDAVCKGCGRTFDEVQHWTALSPGQKRAVWRRITQSGEAWRFNRYAERGEPAAAVTDAGRVPGEPQRPPAAPAAGADPLASRALTSSAVAPA